MQKITNPNIFYWKKKRLYEIEWVKTERSLSFTERGLYVTIWHWTLEIEIELRLDGLVETQKGKKYGASLSFYILTATLVFSFPRW